MEAIPPAPPSPLAPVVVEPVVTEPVPVIGGPPGRGAAAGRPLPVAPVQVVVVPPQTQTPNAVPALLQTRSPTVPTPHAHLSASPGTHSLSPAPVDALIVQFASATHNRPNSTAFEPVRMLFHPVTREQRASLNELARSVRPSPNYYPSLKSARLGRS